MQFWSVSHLLDAVHEAGIPTHERLVEPTNLLGHGFWIRQFLSRRLVGVDEALDHRLYLNIVANFNGLAHCA